MILSFSQNSLNTIKEYFSYKMLIIFFLGFSSGLPFALITVSSTLGVWLYEAGIGKTTAGLFGLITSVYSFKFLWSPIVDSVKLPILYKLFGRRRSWILLSQICLIASIIAMSFADPKSNLFWISLLAFITAICSATQDIVIDGYRIELVEKEKQPIASMNIIFGYRAGLIISGAFALYISKYFSWNIIYLMMAGFLMIGLATTLLAKEPESSSKIKDNINYDSRKEAFLSWAKDYIINPFKDFSKKDSWIIILLFILFYKFCDSFVAIMATYFYKDMGFSNQEIASIIKIWGLVATLFGSFLGAVIVRQFGLIKSLWLAGILQVITNFVFIIQAKIGYNTDMLMFTIIAENTAAGMGSVVFVAYISNLCNAKYSVTQYALLSALATFSRNILSTPSGYIAENFGWVNFFIISIFLAIPGLLLLKLITSVDVNNKMVIKKDG